MATVNQLNLALSGQSGTGSFVGSSSPTLVTPNLDTPSAGVLTNCTGLPGAAYVYLAKQTASSSAELDFTSVMSATYNDYFFTFSAMIPATNGNSMKIQLSTDNGSTWVTSGYVGDNNVWAYNSATPAANTLSTGFILSAGLSSTTQPGASGYCYLTSMQDGNIPAYAGTSVCYGQTAAVPTINLNSGNAGTAMTINAIRVIFTSGSITSGYAVLYGVRQSN